MGLILTEAELDAAIGRDRSDGRTIAFANGCFDLLHVGHVRSLAEVMPAAERAEIVGAITAVDYVVVFPDPNVERLLQRFRPDVHCKGTDYTVETVPERAAVQAYGGIVTVVFDSSPLSGRRRPLAFRIPAIAASCLQARIHRRA